MTTTPTILLSTMYSIQTRNQGHTFVHTQLKFYNYIILSTKAMVNKNATYIVRQ